MNIFGQRARAALCVRGAMMYAYSSRRIGGGTNVRRVSWQVLLGIALITTSAIVHIAHYLIFRDVRNIFFYLILDLGFLPINVLLVTLILRKLLNEREKRALFHKLNMVIGAFFAEVGTKLIGTLALFDSNVGNIRQDLLVAQSWPREQFAVVSQRIKQFQPNINSQNSDLDALRHLLVAKREFLVRLLENPNLLEHESFTDMLWAVFHLMDELSHRGDLRALPPADYAHLSLDMARAYHALIIEWLGYMRHLQERYPYLFSLALRTNPFDRSASVVFSA